MSVGCTGVADCGVRRVSATTASHRSTIMSSTPSETATSLPSIGAHCAVSSCNINDFLPIRCRCDKLFCKDHIFPDTHECSLINRFTPGSSAAVSPALKRCALEKCTKPSLEAFFPDTESATASRSPAVCPQCHLSFCAAYESLWL